MRNPFRRRRALGDGLDRLELDRYQERVQEIQEQVLEELARLTDAGALDSAHATVLDSYISEQFSSLYRDADDRFLQGIRQLEDRHNSLRRTFDKAQQSALLARERQHIAQVEADRAYAHFVGLERPNRAESNELSTEPSSLDLRHFLDQHRDGGFRGDDPAFVTPAGHSSEASDNNPEMSTENE